MPINIDWGNKIINVPLDAMVLIQSVPSVIYQLDLDVFRKTLNDLQDDEEGMPFDTTHTHNPTVTVSGAILARVVQIINGYTVTFVDGQYRVNTVGANSNIGEVTNVNQVSVSTSNSAGLQDLNSLQAASFDGAVALDITSIYTGTVFPVGTRQYPVNNTADAHAIATERGLRVISIMSSMTMDTQDWGEGFIFRGDSVSTVTLTLDPGAGVETTEFENLTVQGTLDGSNVLKGCLILDLVYTNGFIFQCALQGEITLGGNLQLTVMSCYSNIPGGGVGVYPTINMGGSGQNLALRGYSGGIGITNCTGTISSLDFLSGRVVFEPTVISGDFTVRGVADVEDNSTGGTIADMTVNAIADETRKLTANKAVIAPDDLSVIVYDDDGVTPFREFAISPDKRTRDPQ
ncbi:MAG: hypothetical protein ACTSUU_06830 [Candidatus Thorarchaeota archaeon]